MYPLVLIIPIGIWCADRNLFAYVLPFSIMGSFIALYQALLYYGILSETLAPCAVGVSCIQILPTFFGLNLITASLVSFITISALLIIHRRFTHEIN